MDGRQTRRGTLGVLVVAALCALAPRARAATVKGVQSGTAVSTADGVLTVPITPVDPTRSFLIFQTRHDSNRPVGSAVRGRLASATTLEFERVTDEASPVPISIQWYVAEFSSGVSVQRGETRQTPMPVNVPITPVASVSQAFVTWSKTGVAFEPDFNDDNPIVGELFNASTVQFRGQADGGKFISWQVIEFTNAADIDVQKGSTSLTGAALSVDVTLPTPVDVNSTFVLVGYQAPLLVSNIASVMVRAQLIDSTTIRIDRDGNASDVDEIVWQAVQLKDGSTVQRGTTNFASGDGQQTEALTAVETRRSVAFASAQPAGGQNMGKTPYTADDIIGVCSVTTGLTSSQLTLDRDSTVDTCDVGWFVVEFHDNTVSYSVGTNTADLKTGPPQISITGSMATLDVSQIADVGVGDVIDYDSPSQLVYISSVISPTQFTAQRADGSMPAPAVSLDVNSIKRAFNSIGAAVGGSSDALHLNSSDLAGTFRRLQWVLYDDGPFNLPGTASITGYTTARDYNITLTVAGASQVASGNSQRHAGIEGTGARLEMQASAQFALDVDVPYTRIKWLEIDGNDIPMVGGILVKPTGDEVLLRNLIVHNTRGDSSTGSAVNVTVGADDVEIHNLVAYDYGGDGVFMSGSFGKVANSTFYLGQGSGSSSVRTDVGGDTSGYSVLAVGPGTAFREDAPGGLSLYNSISTDTTACDFDFSGSCRTNVSPVSEFMSLGGLVNLHLRPRARARDFGFNLTGVFNDDIDGQFRPMGLAWDTGADEAPVFSGRTNFRSIGTASPYGTGLVDVLNGSNLVTGVGAWLSANRGRGDVITIPCNTFPTCPTGTDYTILAVDSETSLRLTQPYGGTTASGITYRIDRQFDTLQEWEDCISSGGSCVYFPTGGGDLVGDDRSEVGVAYGESVFTLFSDVVFGGSNTDALHTITLTADGVNRHNGTAGAGVIVDGQDNPDGFVVQDDHVTIEWLEIRRVRGASDEAAILVESDGLTSLLFQNLLIHTFYNDGGVAGISLSNSGPGNRNVTIRNVMIWNGDEEGIQGGRTSDRVLIENCSIDDMRFSGSAGIDAADSVVTVVNTIVMGSGAVDYDPDNGSFSPASTNNISEDGSAPGTNALPGLARGAVFAVPGVDLHLRAGAPAIDSGVNLFPTSGFQNDVDGELRPVGAGWDRGADELSSGGLDLALTKDDGQAVAVPGTPISYTITVTNNGPDPVTSVIVTDPVPAAILGSWFSTSNGVYNSGTGLWTFAAPLFVGQSTILTLNGTIDPSATGSLTNGATVFPPPGLTDTFPANDSDADVDTLTAEADLQILKTDDLDPIEVGSLLTYTLTVVNNGPSDATGVTVTDTLAAELDYQSDAPSQGGCLYDGPSRTLTCNLGAIVAGGSATIALVVRTTAVGTVGNTAVVAGNEPDPVTGNNTSTQLTTVETATDGVRFFTVTSTNQQNVLEWLNPGGAAYSSTEILFRTDRFPTGPGDALATSIYDAGTAGLKDRFVHGPGLTNNQTYYYAAFVHRSVVPLVSTGRFCTGYPFDNSGAVKWSFSTGAFSITPPTVGGAGVVAPANDRALYAMKRGPAGGEWPVGWHPAQLGGVVQSRSPVIPLPVNGANPVVYLGAQDGNVYTVSGALGGAPAPFPWAPRSIGGMVQAAPAGIFANWGGAYDYILVGTRDGGADNKMVALNPDTPGNIIGSFDNGGGAGGIGIITGMATVDYATGRLYFTSYVNPTGSNGTLWCVQLDSPSPGPVFTLVWQRALQNIDGSPVVQNGRVYVGSMDGGGTVYSINAATGLMGDDRTFVHGDGPVKGFVWPDRNSSDLYFATNNRVWGITDTGTPAMVDKFLPPGGISLGGGITPSTILFVPGSHYVYAGGSDGQLYEIDVLPATPTQKSVPLGDGLALVGAPSLDWFYNLIHVGTEAGVFYAIQVPLP